MRIDVLTLFPGMFSSVLGESILKIAQEKGKLQFFLHNIRDFSRNKHNTVDDKPYGGGAGMVMRVEPVVRCYEHVRTLDDTPARTLLLTPQGKRYDQAYAKELAGERRLILIAGRYEGFDERVRLIIKPEEVSIGDYVLSGGEIPAMVIIDSISRLIEGVLGDEDSAKDDSFSKGLLEYPHYTRPQVFEGLEVPEVLLSGDHKKIEQWRRKQALQRTKLTRQDLMKKYMESTDEQDT